MPHILEYNSSKDTTKPLYRHVLEAYNALDLSKAHVIEFVSSPNSKIIDSMAFMSGMAEMKEQEIELGLAEPVEFHFMQDNRGLTYWLTTKDYCQFGGILETENKTDPIHGIWGYFNTENDFHWQGYEGVMLAEDPDAFPKKWEAHMESLPIEDIMEQSRVYLELKNKQ